MDIGHNNLQFKNSNLDLTVNYYSILIHLRLKTVNWDYNPFNITAGYVFGLVVK